MPASGERNPKSSSKYKRTSQLFKIMILIYFSPLLPDAIDIEVGQISPHQSPQWTVLEFKNDPCILPLENSKEVLKYCILNM